MPSLRVPPSERREHVALEVDGIAAVVQRPVGAPAMSDETRRALEELVRAAARRMSDGAEGMIG